MENQNKTVEFEERLINAFCEQLKQKMALSRAKGRSGWHDKSLTPNGVLQKMLVEHLEKGDPIDIGIYSMMLWFRNESTHIEQTPTKAFHIHETDYTVAQLLYGDRAKLIIEPVHCDKYVEVDCISFTLFNYNTFQRISDEYGFPFCLNREEFGSQRVELCQTLERYLHIVLAS